MEEFLNVLIQPFDFFWVLALNRRSDIHADLFNIYFYLLFGHPMTNSEHYQEGSLTHPVSGVTGNLITTSF